MELSEWIIQTNQILHDAEQNLPAEYVQQLRMFQQTLMLNHLQSGFLTPHHQTPFQGAIARNPFYNLELAPEADGRWLCSNLGDVFRHANPDSPEQTLSSIEHVLGNRNVVDHSVHPDSPRRDRPAYLDDQNERFMDEGERPQPLKKIDPFMRGLGG